MQFAVWHLPSLTSLVPTWLDLAGWGGVCFAAAVLLGVGRLLSRGRAAPETALLAGWGAASLVLTMVGVTSELSLRWPGVVLAALGGVGLLLPASRLRLPEARSIGRLVVLALPLLAVLASAKPSLPDTFLNLLPNAAYLFDHASFPAAGRPPAYSYLPGAPYNLQMTAFLASLITRDFPAGAMIGFNVIVNLAAGLLLARLAAGGNEDSEKEPSWVATALGVMLATALNPGFVPRYDLSSYGEVSVAVTVAFAGWLACSILERWSAGRSATTLLWLMALVLAALVNVKQDSVALVIGIVGTAGAMAIIAPGRGERTRMFAALGAVALPAAVLYLAWQWYVLDNLPEGELKPLPLVAWQFQSLPFVLGRMLKVMADKAYLFVLLPAVVAASVWRWRRHGADIAARSGLILGGVTLTYNLALIVAYIGHFPGTTGTDAHSYYRYNTHLGLLLMVSIILLMRKTVKDRIATVGVRALRVAAGCVIAVLLLCPIVFLRMLRFDLEVPQLRVRQLAHDMGPFIGDDLRLAMVLPGDNGSVGKMLEGLLRFVPPRHQNLVLYTATSMNAEALAPLDQFDPDLVLVSCTPHSIGDVPPGAVGLWRGDQSLVVTWTYDPPVTAASWSQVLSPAPLCL